MAAPCVEGPSLSVEQDDVRQDVVGIACGKPEAFRTAGRQSRYMPAEFSDRLLMSRDQEAEIAARPSSGLPPDGWLP